MFPALDIPFEYWIEHVTFGLLCVMFIFSTMIFYRGVPGFATDCPCCVWCRVLTICLLYVGLLFGNQVWNDSGFVSLTQWRTTSPPYLKYHVPLNITLCARCAIGWQLYDMRMEVPQLSLINFWPPAVFISKVQATPKWLIYHGRFHDFFICSE